MDFIHDEFIRLEDENGIKYYVAASEIAVVVPKENDKCNIILRLGAQIVNIQMPAEVLVAKINQIKAKAKAANIYCI